MKRLPKGLMQTAISEVKTALQEEFGELLTAENGALEERAEEILQSRIDLIIRENDGFMDKLKKAKVKSHIDSLIKGHYKGLRHQLKLSPGGVSKKTAKEIVQHLFNLKDDD